jgi:hypothetical protein
MTKTANGVFAGFSEAQRVPQTLVAQGLRSENITIIVNREETPVSAVLVGAAWGVTVAVGPARRGERSHSGFRWRRPRRLPGASAEEALVCVAAAEQQVDQVVERMRRSTSEDVAVHGAGEAHPDPHPWAACGAHATGIRGGAGSYAPPMSPGTSEEGNRDG